jgi:sulfide dehydrogenase cytochrome subunit
MTSQSLGPLVSRSRSVLCRPSSVIWFAAVCLFASVATAGAAAPAPSGAASCSGCHPMSAKVETRVLRLAGRKPADIVAAMQAFRSGQKPATVMDRIAKGFSDAEIRAIADWLGAQQ